MVSIYMGLLISSHRELWEATEDLCVCVCVRICACMHVCVKNLPRFLRVAVRVDAHDFIPHHSADSQIHA